MSEDGSLFTEENGTTSFVVPAEAQEEAKKETTVETVIVHEPVEGIFAWLTPENRLRFYAILGAIGSILLLLNWVSTEQWDTYLAIADKLWFIVAIGSQFVSAAHVKPRRAV